MKIKFIVTESFLRTNRRTDPFYDSIIEAINRDGDFEWEVFVWDRDLKCGYPPNKVKDYRLFRKLTIWFYRCCRLVAWTVPVWKIYWLFGFFMRPFFRRRFDADIVITQGGQLANELEALLPMARIVDLQHGVVYSRHSGYFDKEGRLSPMYRFYSHREFWVQGKGYADCFFKNPENEKDLAGRVKIIGDVVRAGEGRSGGVEEWRSDEVEECGSEGVRNVVVFSAQLTYDLTREEMAASVKRMEEFFDGFFRKFGDRYECLVKHHPRYDNVYDMSGFFARFPQVKETKEQWAELYPRMALHVTFCSTVTFDCASAGVPTYLLDFPAAKILKRDLFRDDYAYPYFGKTVEEILSIPAEEARKAMVEWYRKFYAPFSAENCLRLLKGE